jgi:hypothetical protein
MLLLTLITGTFTFSMPRTNVLLRGVHLLLFGAHFMLMFDRRVATLLCNRQATSLSALPRLQIVPKKSAALVGSGIEATSEFKLETADVARLLYRAKTHYFDTDFWNMRVIFSFVASQQA